MESEEVFENVIYTIGSEVIEITPNSDEIIHVTPSSGEVINATISDSFLSDEEDDYKLKALLKSFRLEKVFEHLKAAQVTYRSLKYLRKEDLQEAIPPLGLRVEFREKLMGWKKQEFGIDDDTISIDSNVINWLNRPTTSSASSSKSSVCRTYINKDLFTLLSNTARGTKVLNFYKNKTLDNVNRDEVIAILIEEICYRNISLKPNDFHSLVNDICSIFPSEIEAKEYYYIPRTGKKNPSGKLFYKYSNCRKGKKGSQTYNVPHNEENNQQCTEELDDSIINALKLSLSKGSEDWNEILCTYMCMYVYMYVCICSSYITCFPK